MKFRGVLSACALLIGAARCATSAPNANATSTNAGGSPPGTGAGDNEGTGGSEMPRGGSGGEGGAPAECGNGVVEVGEQCDGNEIRETTCTDLGHDAGILTCADDCLSFDETQCSDCGNGFVEGSEDCDGANLDRKDCIALEKGFTGGTLACQADCSFDTTACGTGPGCPTDNCALRFDGLNDYVSVPHHASLDGGGGALTVEAWLYYDQIAANCMTAVRKGTASSATYDYWLHKNLSPSNGLYWGSWGAFSVVTSDAVVASTWYHYAAIYDPVLNKARTYLNGVFKEVGTPYDVPTSNTDELRIGIDWDMGCAMDGIIDEVRISSVVRYDADFVPSKVFASDADTVALYHFDEYEGLVAADDSANGNTGDIHGATWTTEHP